VWQKYFLDGLQLSEVGLVDADRFSRWLQQTGSRFPRRCQGGGRGFSTECGPVDFSVNTPVTSLEEHFRSAAATVENTWNRQAVRRTVGIH